MLEEIRAKPETFHATRDIKKQDTLAQALILGFHPAFIHSGNLRKTLVSKMLCWNHK